MTGGSRWVLTCASSSLPAHERRRLLDPLRQAVDLGGCVVEIEAGPGGGGHAQATHGGGYISDQYGG